MVGTPPDAFASRRLCPPYASRLRLRTSLDRLARGRRVHPNHIIRNRSRMLARLSIRDIVLIERLDIEFCRGLAVLTGETGAGKSILLDAFALALGGRGDAGLVRHGVEQGQVTATFDVPKGHLAAAILADNGLDDNGEMILRRVQLADGRTRAFINDQAISVQTLKAVGSALVEIHGQHDERALVDASTHRRLL